MKEWLVDNEEQGKKEKENRGSGVSLIIVMGFEWGGHVFVGVGVVILPG
jgi:hypothetical protein